jgi:signal transduction histidine kinase
MGEMIGAIAHQWRQPLNALTIQIQSLKYNYKNNEINEEFLNNFISKNKKTIQFMSNTIDDFRNFFRIDKEKNNFNVKQTIESVVSMQKAQLINHDIKLNINGDEFEYYGLKSEFQQVILNIINNAKDAFVEKNIKDAVIDIKLNKKDKSIIIKDNAGGIPDDIIKRIFEPYFTTKEQGKGTGMGLYMSKMIIVDNMNSVLEVTNDNNGAVFTIKLKEDSDEK